MTTLTKDRFRPRGRRPLHAANQKNGVRPKPHPVYRTRDRNYGEVPVKIGEIVMSSEPPAPRIAGLGVFSVKSTFDA